MTDHRQAAESYIRAGMENGLGAGHLALTQIRATLALAEQQRLANLQRYSASMWNSYAEDDLTDQERATLEVQCAAIGAIVREGLGLA